MKFFFCGGSNIDPITRINDLIYEQKYSHIVSQHFNADHINEGIRSGSNKRSIRKIFYEYDMNEFDFICIEVTPKPRTEFYNDREKKWINVVYPCVDKVNEKLVTAYYNEIYNDDYAKLQHEIEFMTIKKYLTAIKKPFILINTDYKNKNFCNYDFEAADYHIKETHLTKLGHKMLAKDIITYYENILQR